MNLIDVAFLCCGIGCLIGSCMNSNKLSGDFLLLLKKAKKNYYFAFGTWDYFFEKNNLRFTKKLETTKSILNPLLQI